MKAGALLHLYRLIRPAGQSLIFLLRFNFLHTNNNECCLYIITEQWCILMNANATSFGCLSPFSPEGSYTDDTSQEHQTPQKRTTPPKPGPPNPDPHEFDDEFDDDDPLLVIGHCKALYSFDGNDQHHECYKCSQCCSQREVTRLLLSNLSVFNAIMLCLTLRSERGDTGDGRR